MRDDRFNRDLGRQLRGGGWPVLLAGGAAAVAALTVAVVVWTQSQPPVGAASPLASGSSAPSPTSSPDADATPTFSTPAATPAPSTLGIGWDPASRSVASGQVRRIAVEGGVYWALGFTSGGSGAGANPMLWRSTDAEQWSPVELPFPAAIPREPQVTVWAEHIVAADGRLLVIGTAGALDALRAVAWASTDGTTWTETAAPPVFRVLDVTAGPGGLVIASGGFAGGMGSAWLSTDGGRTWQEHRPAGMIELSAVVGTNTGYLAAGASDDEGSNVNLRPRIWGSADGRTWTQRPIEGSDARGQVEALTVNGAGQWVAIGMLNGRPASWRSGDGTTWASTNGSALENRETQAEWRLAGLPAGFVLINSAGSTWMSRDGNAWEARDPVPSSDGGENAAGVARIGQRVAIVDNLHPFGTGSTQEGWKTWVGIVGS